MLHSPAGDQEQPPGSKARRFPSTRAISVAVFALAGILVAAAVGVSLWDPQQLQALKLNELKRLSITAAEATARSLEATNVVLQQIVDEIGATGASTREEMNERYGTEAAHKALVLELKNLPQIAALVLVDSEGWTINFTRTWPINRTRIDEREQFRALKVHSTDKPFVSEPVQNKFDGTWTVYLARRVDAPDGTFLGLVQAAMVLSSYEDFYAAIAPPESGVIALRRHDGRLMARHPSAGIRFGASADGREDMMKLVLSPAPTSGPLTGADGTGRLAGASPVRGYPLSIIPSVSEETLMQPWRRKAAITVGVAIVGALGISLLTLAALRQYRHLFCQIASNRDPHFASNHDPSGMYGLGLSG